MGNEQRIRMGNRAYGFIASLAFATMIVSGCGGGGAGGSAADGTSPIAVAVNAASLVWSQPTTKQDGSPLTDLAGYKVYYGQTTPVTVANSFSVEIEDPNQMSYATDLSSGTYYFTVTAFDSNGNESAMSDEVSKTI